MAIAGFYDLKNRNFVYLGGQRIGGWGEEGGIEYEEVSPLVEHMVGASGFPVVSNVNDNRLLVTLTVLAQSRSANILHELIQQQVEQFRGTGAILPLPYSHEDTLNGDKVADPCAIFLTRLLPTKGRTASERTTQILLPNAGDPRTMDIGALNLVGD